MAAKVSLITTTYNESNTIEQFIASIEKQSLQPTEVIIVDAGSPDKTTDKIRQYIEREKIEKSKYTVIVKKRVSRSEGRNIAISKANNKIIAVTDVGCRLDPDWLKNITKPLIDKKVNAVAGFYLPIIENAFQEAISGFVCSPVEKMKPGFLPSSRSVAFRKVVWLKVGGYPDELNYCEDLVFDQKVIKAGYRFKIAPKAIVYWPQRKNIIQAFRQFYHYAYGDGQMFFSDLQTHSKKITLLYLRYLLLVIFFIILSVEPRLLVIPLIVYALYLIRPVYVYRRRLKSLLTCLYVPVIKLIADFAVITGSFAGILAGRK